MGWKPDFGGIVRAAAGVATGGLSEVTGVFGKSGGGGQSQDNHAEASIYMFPAHGRNNVSVGRNEGVIKTVAPEIVKDAFKFGERGFEYGEKIAEHNTLLSAKALEDMRKVSTNGMILAQNINTDSLSRLSNISADSLSKLSTTARDSLRANEAVTGEAFEKITESNERNAGLINKTLNIGKQQSTEAMNALSGVITRNQIGAAQVQVENMNKLIYMVGAVLIIGYFVNGRRYGK